MIKSYYPSGEHGKPPVGIRKMLRMYLLQIWFNLSDEGMEEAVCDNYAFRQFMEVDFTGGRQVSDATTLLKFRHIPEKNGLGGKIFADVNRVTLETARARVADMCLKHGVRMGDRLHIVLWNNKKGV